MKTYILYISLFLGFTAAFGQQVGIVRKNYSSTYYDSTLMVNIDILDSATIRLGSIDPITGVVTNIGNSEYTAAINLNGATLDPYLNRYYIGSGFNLFTFDISSGNLINTAPITGPLPSASFQNLRFNPSDSVIYGMVPHNFYSTYYDSTLMMPIEVLDSALIRFASIDPVSGVYTLIGNTSYNNIYTLAGNSVDPYQMVYYYSAVDTLIGIDLYTGAPFSEAPIQLPPFGIFENIAYSCIDTTIYGLTRQNYISNVFDSLFMDYMDVVDSTTFRLSKINPTTGAVTFISPGNIGVGGNLTGGAFIDPNSMTYFFSHGNQLVGVSLITGLVTSMVTKTFDSGAFAFDMMRSTQNCFGAAKIRFNSTAGLQEPAGLEPDLVLFPNPANDKITLRTNVPYSMLQIVDISGNIILQTQESTADISGLAGGIYFAKVITEKGVFTATFIKN